MHPDVLSTRHRQRMEMLATDDADSRTASRRCSQLTIETHRTGTGFGAFAAACMQRQNVSDAASFSLRRKSRCRRKQGG
jgi:hypothetical protein